MLILIHGRTWFLHSGCTILYLFGSRTFDFVSVLLISLCVSYGEIRSVQYIKTLSYSHDIDSQFILYVCVCARARACVYVCIFFASTLNNPHYYNLSLCPAYSWYANQFMLSSGDYYVDCANNYYAHTDQN